MRSSAKWLRAWCSTKGFEAVTWAVVVEVALSAGSPELVASDDMGSGPVVPIPRLHPLPRRRSAVAANPLRAISTHSARGRQINDTAARLLALLEHPTDELIIADVIALAELRVKADELRRDPNASPLDIVRLEGLVDRRTRRLGLDRRGKREPDADPGLGQLLVDEHAQGRGEAIAEQPAPCGEAAGEPGIGKPEGGGT
jgi:hypothetical protein